MPFGEGGWIPAFEKITYDVSGIGHYKAFFWENLSTLKPLCDSYENK